MYELLRRGGGGEYRNKENLTTSYENLSAIQQQQVVDQPVTFLTRLLIVFSPFLDLLFHL
jgi:hypothetical protein